MTTLKVDLQECAVCGRTRSTTRWLLEVTTAQLCTQCNVKWEARLFESPARVLYATDRARVLLLWAIQQSDRMSMDDVACDYTALKIENRARAWEIIETLRAELEAAELEAAE